MQYHCPFYKAKIESQNCIEGKGSAFDFHFRFTSNNHFSKFTLLREVTNSLTVYHLFLLREANDN